MKQLIAQLVHNDPNLISTIPGVFNTRQFRKATTLSQTLKLFASVVRSLELLVVVIDRLDLCVLDSKLNANEYNPTMDEEVTLIEALSILVKAHPRTLRVIVTTAGIVTPDCLPNLPISFAMVGTRRPPRRRYEDWSGKHHEEREDPWLERAVVQIAPKHYRPRRHGNLSHTHCPAWLIPYS